MQYSSGEEVKTKVNKVFDYIFALHQCAAQLKVNHWQTTSYAEHKATDAFIKVLHKTADELAESAMGEFGRPKINSTHITVTDNTITSTRWTLDTIKQKTEEISEEVKEFAGLLAIVDDFDAELKKAMYLATLE